ncbi:mitochondrial carrier domain-containing protein [Papiliotrema laurentii]|uniref:Mitochondrial carrier domain-containing protein n=1 Tax=Papiliotrema laurentii TaxID=5418 RepID=A0AAD9CT32_PAPLA|nr:mitochondrial carrier domain-containing protein [Papiliotrema laurentii]
MKVRPDLSYPGVPDVDELVPHHPRHVDQGGTSLRDDSFEWPESGPSESSKVKGNDPRLEDDPAIGPFGAKVIAAMTGAMTTSLLMTPFDVLKTRLQTVQPHPKPSYPSWQPPRPASDCCQTSVLTPNADPKARVQPVPSNPLTCFSSASPRTALDPHAAESSLSNVRPAQTPVAPPSGCLHPSKWAGIWGEAVTLEQAMARGVTGMNGGSATLILPLEEAGAGVIGGFWNELATVRRETGVKGLWKGVGTTMAMGVPSSAIYMLGYEYLLTVVSPIFTGTSDPAANASSLNRAQGSEASLTASLTPAPLIAGSLARTLSATVISPIEMFRTRLQALPSGRGTPTYASTAADMSALVKSKGVSVLWRGLGPTLWRDVPFSGIYWAGFEILKSRLASDRSPLPPLSPIATSFISGALSGTLSALVTQPFDVLKTRRQVFTPSPECSPAALAHRASTLPLALHVIKTEGWGALFAGTVPRCGKVAPACGLMIACYEGVGRWLGGRDD